MFAEHQIQPRIGMEVESNEAIKQAVHGGAWDWASSIKLELETRRLPMLNVEHFPLLRHWFVAHRANKRLSSAALAFKDFYLSIYLTSITRLTNLSSWYVADSSVIFRLYRPMRRLSETRAVWPSELEILQWAK